MNKRTVSTDDQTVRGDVHLIVCDRCGEGVKTWMMSMFTTDEICMDCVVLEKAHPDYDKARAMERAALLSGDRNFPGIGLPADLAWPVSAELTKARERIHELEALCRQYPGIDPEDPAVEPGEMYEDCPISISDLVPVECVVDFRVLASGAPDGSVYVLEHVYNTLMLRADNYNLRVCMRDGGFELKLDNGEWVTQDALESLAGWREPLACLVHDIWTHWMTYLLSKGYKNKSGEFCFSMEDITRWRRQMMTHYDELTEEEQDSDRKIADQILSVLNNEQGNKPHGESVDRRAGSGSDPGREQGPEEAVCASGPEGAGDGERTEGVQVGGADDLREHRTVDAPEVGFTLATPHLPKDPEELFTMSDEARNKLLVSSQRVHGENLAKTQQAIRILTQEVQSHSARLTHAAQKRGGMQGDISALRDDLAELQEFVHALANAVQANTIACNNAMDRFSQMPTTNYNDPYAWKRHGELCARAWGNVQPHLQHFIERRQWELKKEGQ